MREIIKEGKDTDDAINLACAELGVERDEVGWEILTVARPSAFLGLRKAVPAKVRVYVKENPLDELKDIVQEIVQEKTPEKAPLALQEKMQELAKEPSREKEPRAAAQEAVLPSEVKQYEPQRRQAADEASPEQAGDAVQQAHSVHVKYLPMDQAQGKALVACTYVHEVLANMGVDAQISFSSSENAVTMRLAGEGLGVVIGRRGETLDALQYLASLVANRAEGDYMRVTIDSGNYREKRERTLQQLAKKLSASVLRNGRNTMLEPMNPYERRIIHSTVSQMEGVTSASIGEEPNRRVVISPTNPRPRPPYRGKGGGAPRNGARPPRRDGQYKDRPARAGNRDERPPRPPREAGRPTPTDIDRAYALELEREPALKRPERQPEKTAVRESTAPVREKASSEGENLPLYGKIEL